MAVATARKGREKTVKGRHKSDQESKQQYSSKQEGRNEINKRINKIFSEPECGFAA